MRIAYTIAPEKGRTDLLLHDLAQTLTQRGYRPCGSVQINSGAWDNGKCDMDVKVLPGGPIIRISQSLGGASKGCRLDPSALEQAVAMTERALQNGADLLIVNKFGKHEAEGRGFRMAIAMAAEKGVPVIVGVNRLNLGAFESFSAGMASQVAPSEQALVAWLESCTEMA